MGQHLCSWTIVGFLLVILYWATTILHPNGTSWTFACSCCQIWVLLSKILLLLLLCVLIPTSLQLIPHKWFLALRISRIGPYLWLLLYCLPREWSHSQQGLFMRVCICISWSIMLFFLGNQVFVALNRLMPWKFWQKSQKLRPHIRCPQAELIRAECYFLNQSTVCLSENLRPWLPGTRLLYPTWKLQDICLYRQTSLGRLDWQGQVWPLYFHRCNSESYSSFL